MLVFCVLCLCTPCDKALFFNHLIVSFSLNKILAIDFCLFIKHLLFKNLLSPKFLDLMLECNGTACNVNPNYKISIAHYLQGKLTQDKFDIAVAGNNSYVL